MEKHINVAAAVQIGFSLLAIITAFVLFTILQYVGDFVDDSQATVVLRIVSKVILITFVALSLPGILAGIGLFKRKEWARILALIIAVIDLVNFPIGTAIGIYTIWVLSNNEVIAEFRKQNA